MPDRWHYSQKSSPLTFNTLPVRTYLHTHTHTHTHIYIYLYISATLAYVKEATFREMEVEGFVKHLILKIILSPTMDGYSHVP
jgi:hypothetical protein